MSTIFLEYTKIMLTLSISSKPLLFFEYDESINKFGVHNIKSKRSYCNTFKESIYLAYTLLKHIFQIFVKHYIFRT